MTKVVTPTAEELAMYTQLQKQQQAEAMTFQLQSELRQVAHQIYIDLLKVAIAADGVDSVTMVTCRHLAKRAEQLSPFVMERMTTVCQVKDWPKE